MSRPSAAEVRAPVSPKTLKDPAAVAAAYERWIERTGLAAHTKRAYAGRVRGYAAWLAASEHHDPVKAFTEPLGRDYAVRDYRRHLLAEAKRAPRTVALSLTALASFYDDWLGLGKPAVKKVAIPDDDEPKAITLDQTRAMLRAAERRGVRDLALVSTLLLTGVRVAELSVLDVDDLWLTDRRGELSVRSGKGEQPRKVPINSQARDALRPWLAERPTWAAEDESALWVARRGGHRITAGGLAKTVKAVGEDARVHLTPHMLRHTFAVMHVQVHGTDLPTVAGFLGHRRLETTRVYQKSTIEHRQTAADKLVVDF